MPRPQSPTQLSCRARVRPSSPPVRAAVLQADRPALSAMRAAVPSPPQLPYSSEWWSRPSSLHLSWLHPPLLTRSSPYPWQLSWCPRMTCLYPARRRQTRPVQPRCRVPGSKLLAFALFPPWESRFLTGFQRAPRCTPLTSLGTNITKGEGRCCPSTACERIVNVLLQLETAFLCQGSEWNQRKAPNSWNEGAVPVAPFILINY